MVAINIKAFRGQVPRTSDRLLKSNQAVRALNCKLTSGRLDPLAGLGLVFTTTGNIKTTNRYRVYRNEVFETNWLTWDSDVDVAQSLIANDAEGRFYFTGENFEPRMSTYTAAISATPYPTAWFALGVSAPSTAAGVTVAGGAAPTESRSYVYTYVTTLGEESPPSPPSTIVTGNASGTWTVASMQTAPPNSGTITGATTTGTGRVRITLNTVFGIQQYDTLTFASVVGMTSLNTSYRVLTVNVASSYVEVALQTAQTYTSGGTWTRNAPHNVTGMVKRIYRTVGTAGTFLYVGEVAVATTSYADTVTSADLGEVLPTADSSTPPKNLVSIAALPNGCLVGIAENELCFSDPYMPYSWPVRNRYSFSGRGVAVVPSINAVILLTDTFPVLFTGSDPQGMSASTLETYAPCVAKRGIANVGGGALYPSYDGLWLIAPGRVECITRNLYRVDEWSLLNPATFDAAFHDNKYYAAYVGAESRMIVLDITEADSIIEVDDYVTDIYRNDYDGKLYVAKANKLYQWDYDGGKSYESDWLSASFQLPKPLNFTTAQIHADYSAIVPINTTQIAANAALIALGADAVSGHLNGMELLSMEVNGSNIIPVDQDTPKRVQFTLFSKDVPVFTKNVTSVSPFRMPAGYLTEVYSVGINTSVNVYTITVAESVFELSQTSA
jgi:hypothetical protein